jgi:hypothetical protein
LRPERIVFRELEDQHQETVRATVVNGRPKRRGNGARRNATRAGLGFRRSVLAVLYSRFAVAIEGIYEIVRDLLRRASLDLPALEHEHELAVLE